MAITGEPTSPPDNDGHASPTVRRRWMGLVACRCRKTSEFLFLPDGGQCQHRLRPAIRLAGNSALVVHSAPRVPVWTLSHAREGQGGCVLGTTKPHAVQYLINAKVPVGAPGRGNFSLFFFSAWFCSEKVFRTQTNVTLAIHEGVHQALNQGETDGFSTPATASP